MHFSAANQDHAFERHGAEFLACLPQVEATITVPEYIGQSPRHPSGFEMVRAIEGHSGPGTYLLVAVSLNFDVVGRYPIQSVYPIAYATVRRRLRKGHLVRVCPETAKTPHLAGSHHKA